MSQALRKLAGTLNRTDTICLFTNQLREKIGVMFGNPETTPGRPRAEVLRVGPARHPPHRDAEGRRRGVRQPRARQGGQEQGRAAVQAGRVRHHLRLRASPGRARCSTSGSSGRSSRSRARTSASATSGSARAARTRRAFLRENPDVVQQILARIQADARRGPDRLGAAAARRRRPRTKRRSRSRRSPTEAAGRGRGRPSPSRADGDASRDVGRARRPGAVARCVIADARAPPRSTAVRSRVGAGVDARAPSATDGARDARPRSRARRRPRASRERRRASRSPTAGARRRARFAHELARAGLDAATSSTDRRSRCLEPERERADAIVAAPRREPARPRATSPARASRRTSWNRSLQQSRARDVRMIELSSDVFPARTRFPNPMHPNPSFHQSRPSAASTPDDGGPATTRGRPSGRFREPPCRSASG